MTTLQNKIDFMVLVTVRNANPNGDPGNGNRPRVDSSYHGEISSVCIKRKMRDRMHQNGYDIFLLNDDSDGFTNERDRLKNLKQGLNDGDDLITEACKKYLDIRSFGQVIAHAKDGDNDSFSSHVHGPVSIQLVKSVNEVDVESMSITKSSNSVPPKKAGGKSADTMGQKHFVRFGLYVIKGSINPYYAEKTGFTHDDAEVIKECFLTLFENDESSARPAGSMVVERLYWWEHNCKSGQCASHHVFNSVKIKQKDDVIEPNKFEDFEITIEPSEKLNGLEPEIIIP